MFTVAKSVLISNNNTSIKNMESKTYSKVMFLLYFKGCKHSRMLKVEKPIL